MAGPNPKSCPLLEDREMSESRNSQVVMWCLAIGAVQYLIFMWVT